MSQLIEFIIRIYKLFFFFKVFVKMMKNLIPIYQFYIPLSIDEIVVYIRESRILLQQLQLSNSVQGFLVSC